jgi:hypothetical protein
MKEPVFATSAAWAIEPTDSCWEQPFQSPFGSWREGDITTAIVLLTYLVRSTIA